LTCDSAREVLELYVAGALAADESRRFEAHVAGCRACSAELGTYSSVVEGLGRAATALGVLPLVLTPELGDFNEDLRRLGSSRLVANLARQLVPDDATAYLSR